MNGPPTCARPIVLASRSFSACGVINYQKDQEKGGSRHTTLQEQLLFLVAEVEIQANAGCDEQCSSFWCEYLMDRDINTNEIWKRNMKHTPTAALSLPAPCPGTSGEEEYDLHRVICGAFLDTSSKCLCVCTRRERKERTFRDRHVGENMIK